MRMLDLLTTFDYVSLRLTVIRPVPNGAASTINIVSGNYKFQY
jgi:hypothetical protein